MDRKKASKSERKSFHLLLPQHIIEKEILPRLPVQSLFRFRFVSKSWCSLIDSKAFIKTHLLNSSRNTAFPYSRLTIDWEGGIRIQQCSPQSRLDRSIDDPNLTRLKFPTIVGCLNGLVCFLEHHDCSFAFWNPSTRNFRMLPKAHDEDSSDWHIFNPEFGWDESSDEYMVFAVVLIKSKKEFIGKVYGSKTSSWKTIEYLDLQHERKSPYVEGIFVGGKLHWSRDEEEIYISCFDLKTEVLGKIAKPYKYNPGSNFESRLGVIGGYLSSVKFHQESPKEVWVMKEYGAKESWSKLVSLSHVQELVQRPLSATYAVGGRGRDGEVLLLFGRFFLVYYPPHNEFHRLPGISVWQEYFYVESLVWPQFA